MPFGGARTAVVVGVSGAGDLAQLYGFRTMLPLFFGEAADRIAAHFGDTLPEWTEDSFPGILMNVAAGRIANRFDLGGMNALVDAACASSLAALYLGVKELASGASDMVVVGGADSMQSPFTYMCFAQTHALSPRGRTTPFDAGADGIVIGEAVAFCVLKRLADAERDGDRIYAVVKGMGASSDGRDRSLTAPGVAGQERALARAYRQAGVSPAAVGLVEAHATSTVEGDRVEVESLTRFFTAAGAAPASCALGSVKSMIGHTKSAAGLSSLIKAALAVFHGVLPPTLGVETPNQGLASPTSPFFLPQEARPWLPRRPGPPRLAGVSAFGFGGTNFHTVLAEHQGRFQEAEVPAPWQRWPTELFVWRAASRQALAAEVAAAAARLAGVAGVDLFALAWQTRTREVRLRPRLPAGSPVLAVVAEDVADLAAKLAVAGSFLAGAEESLRDPRGIYCTRQPLAAGGSIAFLFPGQGSQYPGMLADLAVQLSPVRERFAASDALLLERLGARLSDFIFPPPAYSEEGRRAQAKLLARTDIAQPAMGTADLALCDLLAGLGITPAMTAGHSYGEYVALAAAGAIDPGDLILLSEARGRFIRQGAGEEPGTMAAVEAEATRVAALLDGLAQVWVANRNSPRQTVISGAREAVALAAARLEAAGIKARPIPVAAAFHSPVMAPAGTRLADYLATVPLAAPRVPVYSNTTGCPYPEEPAAIRTLLGRHLLEGIDFIGEILAMHEAGARIFIEVGPGRVLTGLAEQILAGRPHLAVASCLRDRSGLTGLQHLAAELLAQGVPVDWAGLDQGRLPPERPPEPAAVASERPACHGLWLVSGAGVRPAPASPWGSAPVRAITPYPVGSAATAAPAGGPPAGAAGLLVRHHELMAALAQGQEELMLRYLGPPAGARQDAAPRLVRHHRLMEHLAGGQGALMRRFLQGQDPAVPEEEAATEPAAVPAVPRCVPKILPAPAVWPKAPLPAGRVVLITDDGRGVAAGLAATLAEQGLPPVLLQVSDQGLARADREGAAAAALTPEAVAALIAGIAAELGLVGAVVHLAPLAAAEPLPALDLAAWRRLVGRETVSLFLLLQACQEGLSAPGALGRPTVLAATGLGGAFGLDGSLASEAARPSHGGVAGLVKTVALEWPQARVKVVDLDPAGSVPELTAVLRTELAADDGLVEVGWRAGVRCTVGLVETPDLAGRPAAWEPDASSVLLVTGGGRGIAARAARELAARFRPTLVLVGRTPLAAGPEETACAGLAEPAALRQALTARLAAQGQAVTPAQVERAAREVLARREIRANLARLQELGSQAVYREADVRNEAALGQLLAGIYRDFGRLDGVIHAAGVIEDAVLANKSLASFERVFGTKVESAFLLARLLRLPDLKLLAFFSSVAGRFGNAGQADYTAANDLVNKLALYLDARMPGRVAALNWGPWAGGGMASPAVQAAFARRGVGLIDPAAGAAACRQELVQGAKGEVEVVLGAGPWQDLGPLAADLGRLPLLADARLEAAGQAFRRTLSPAHDLFLDHHRLDGRPVLPAAFAVELMAEAAAAGRPDWVLQAVEEVRVLKGIVLDGEEREIRIAVAPAAGGKEGEMLRLAASIADDPPPAPPLYTATVVLGRRPAPAPAWPALPAPGSLPPFPLTVAEAYQERLFHGPLLQGLTAVDGVSETAMLARLFSSPPRDCLATRPAASWLIDPVVMDIGLQMALLWARQHLDCTVLPSRFAALRVYAPFPADRAISCHLEVQDVLDRQSVRYTMRFADDCGRPLGLIDSVEATGSPALNRLAGHVAYTGLGRGRVQP
ncbi:MAG: SDR family NAD(P)-dependent oxidoreductase [Thermodesulfobacteriota bacterium]